MFSRNYHVIEESETIPKNIPTRALLTSGSSFYGTLYILSLFLPLRLVTSILKTSWGSNGLVEHLPSKKPFHALAACRPTRSGAAGITTVQRYGCLARSWLSLAPVSNKAADCMEQGHNWAAHEEEETGHLRAHHGNHVHARQLRSICLLHAPTYKHLGAFRSPGKKEALRCAARA